MENDLWWVGVIIALGGCALAAIGDAFQKWAHTESGLRKAPAHKETDQERFHEQSYISRYYGNLNASIATAFGISCVIFEAFMDWTALCFSAQSLIASLGAASVVVNTIIAPFLIGEKLYPLDILITFLVFTGTTLCLVYSDHSSTEIPASQLPTILVSTSFLRYALCLSLIIICLFLIYSNRHYHILARLPISNEQVSSFGRALHMLSIPTIAALFGGLSNMFSKASSSIVYGDGEQDEKGPISWVIHMFMVVCLILEIIANNEALRHYEALVVVPIYDVVFGFFGIVNGDVLFHDMKDFTQQQWLFFSLGGIINLSAIMLLLTRPDVDLPVVDTDCELYESDDEDLEQTRKYLLVPIDEDDMEA